MFTREPYGKLLSGYVDKLFAPNPYFWKAIGRLIIRKFRKDPSPESLTCGHDVTFSGPCKKDYLGEWMEGWVHGLFFFFF